MRKDETRCPRDEDTLGFCSVMFVLTRSRTKTVSQPETRSLRESLDSAQQHDAATFTVDAQP